MGPELRRRSAGRTRPVSERGSSVIGFLLVFPLVLFMSFGLFQFALYALAVEEISTAAQEAARRAALDGSTLDNGAALARDFVSDGRVLRGDIAVTGSRGPAETTVTVTGRCKWLLSDHLFGDVCDISRTATVPTEEFVEGLVAS